MNACNNIGVVNVIHPRHSFNQHARSIIQDRIKSRRTLVAVLREVVACLTVFVVENPENQKLVARYLPQICEMTGSLTEPLLKESSSADLMVCEHLALYRNVTIGAEELILETVRDNIQLCQYNIPLKLFEEFGHRLEVAITLMSPRIRRPCSPWSNNAAPH